VGAKSAYDLVEAYGRRAKGRIASQDTDAK